MATITLRAHFDGERIRLDEPFELKLNTQLLVTVLPGKTDEEYEDWALLSVQGLAYAYADDEIDYPLSLIKEANPDHYEGLSAKTEAKRKAL